MNRYLGRNNTVEFSGTGARKPAISPAILQNGQYMIDSQIIKGSLGTTLVRRFAFRVCGQPS